LFGCFAEETALSRLACDPIVLLLNEKPSSQNELVESLTLPGFSLLVEEFVVYF
jgi:hypothetical protein